MNDALGIIFTDSPDLKLGELTEHRASAAVPFAGRYRLVDFILSSLVNSGVGNVGLTTQHNYSSLMDHVGSGKPWDLDRKTYGLFILPPSIGKEDYAYPKGDIDVLHGIMTYLRRSRQRYVILSRGHIVFNIDFKRVLDFHTGLRANITAVCQSARGLDFETLSKCTLFDLGEGGRALAVEQKPRRPKAEYAGIEVYIIEKELLTDLVEEAVQSGEHDFVTSILMPGMKNLGIYVYEFGGYVGRVHSLRTYYQTSMDVLKSEVKDELFGNPDFPIYTKAKDRAPTRYGESALASNCLVADGCLIEGQVEDSIIFRGVRVGKGAKVLRSIVMQDSVIEKNAEIEHVVLDKECVVRSGKRLIGQENHPIVLAKRSLV